MSIRKYATNAERQKAYRTATGVPPAKNGRPRKWATDRQRYPRDKGFKPLSFRFTVRQKVWGVSPASSEHYTVLHGTQIAA
jgi:hypothetical protein